MKHNNRPPDHEQRRLITEELHKNMMVEAAAGTGKTTSLVDRMLGLLCSGRCGIRNLVAVTFTRKAASELRGRFQVELEKSVQTSGGKQKERLSHALLHIEQAFIGTIHSFCARLLRERPVEAGVDVSFGELDPDSDHLLKKEAWREYIETLPVSDPEGVLDECRSLGMRVPDYEEAFITFSDYPDVDLWPGEEHPLPLPDMKPVIQRIHDYAGYMKTLLPRLPEQWTTDRLIEFYREFPDAFPTFDLSDPADIYLLLSLFNRSRNVIQKDWMAHGMFTRDECKKEQERWERFRKEVIAPALTAWHESRYHTVIKILKGARQIYDHKRKILGKLNYQDLLMYAALLLRENSHVRKYFKHHYTHLLIDEFQDTDPVQAEVMLLLTATDPHEKDWHRCIPEKGTLFVVGDPKQSIYRFRRADISTYYAVKRIICESGKPEERGLLVRLSANFRSQTPVREWVNLAFSNKFPKTESKQSPVYVPLCSGKADSADEAMMGMKGVYKLTVPRAYSKTNIEAAVYEAGVISRFIRRAIDYPVNSASPSDFMIITRYRERLSLYADELQKYGIPYSITGGATLNEPRELNLLTLCLKAVLNPDNPVVLVGVLRSELFGISDAALYSYKKAGGKFNYNASIPETLMKPDAGTFIEAFETLKLFHKIMSKIPPIAALEKIIDILGLIPLACMGSGGHIKAGSLVKTVELLRKARDDIFSPQELVDCLSDYVDQVVCHDGISILQEQTDVVRVMNLHQAKGLEAKVVFLADPSGESEKEPYIHINRGHGKTKGYLAVKKKAGTYRSTVCAIPQNWESLSEEEKLYLDAEALRLRYVAATRACSVLVIVQREAKSANNPWHHFSPYLEAAGELPDYPDVLPLQQEKTKYDTRDIEYVLNSINESRILPSRSTYAVEQAKEYALGKAAEETIAVLPVHQSESTGEGRNITGESGVEWGEMIHRLLETAMNHPGKNFTPLAEALLAEYGLNTGLKEQALLVVNAVIESEIWRRAQNSLSVFTEIPFQTLLDRTGAGKLLTIIRGVIDLVFFETEGWVIVDYKTDRVKNNNDLESLARYYGRQVRFYADFWQRATGEKVNELGLYFTSPGKYVRIELR
jgi:ATP-dependent helicase/nuclease subunit A